MLFNSRWIFKCSSSYGKGGWGDELSIWCIRKKVDEGSNTEFDLYEYFKVAASAGITLDEFWKLTPYELGLIIKSKNELKEEETKERITIAYITALWTAQWFSKKRPKPLEEILQLQTKPKKEMTDEEMLLQVKNLNAIFGGEVVKTSGD